MMSVLFYAVFLEICRQIYVQRKVLLLSQHGINAYVELAVVNKVFVEADMPGSDAGFMNTGQSDR